MSSGELICPKTGQQCERGYCRAVQAAFDEAPDYKEDTLEAFGVVAGAVLVASSCSQLREEGLRDIAAGKDVFARRAAQEALGQIRLGEDLSSALSPTTHKLRSVDSN